MFDLLVAALFLTHGADLYRLVVGRERLHHTERVKTQRCFFRKTTHTKDFFPFLGLEVL